MTLRALASVALLSCAPRPITPPASAPTPSAQPALSARPSPASDLVYFVMVDRFANGDPTNDGDIDLADPQAFHGGDLQGVIDHVDHLQSLGVRTVWLSPIFQMRTTKIDEWGAFHGYWVTDLARVEPRFGDTETLARLSDALHTRGMRLVLDMVYNHTGYDSALLADKPEWFHQTGDVVDWDDPVQVETHRVHGLPDLAQERPEVHAYLRDVTLHWVRTGGVDGLRVDAVRHMPADWLARLNTELDAAVEGGVWTLGEDFQGNAAALSKTMEKARFDAMFDFPLRYALIDVFCHSQDVGRLASTLSEDRLYADPSRLVTFLDNHDLPRLESECANPDDADTALAALFGVRGTPSLTWGTEARLAGAEEPHNRADMPWDTPHPRAAAISELAAMRAAHPALVSGERHMLALEGGAMAVAWSDAQETVVLALNRGTNAWRMPEAWRTDATVLLARGGATDAGLLPSGALQISARPRAEWLPQPASTRPVSVRATGPLAPGEELRMVGSGPELGNWTPSDAPVVAHSAPPDESAQVDLPDGEVISYKLVVLTPDGTARWEDRANRYALVNATTALDLTWGGE